MELNNDQYSEKLAQILENYYTNEEFLKSIINISDRNKRRIVMDDFAIILKYYIMSRDMKTYDNMQDILKKYINIHRLDIKRGGKAFEEYRRKYDELCDNIENYGYITHSYYGKEGEYLKKYGLNYIAHLSQEEYEEYINAKYALYGLIDYFREAKYSINKRKSPIFLFNHYEVIPIDRNERLYFSTPGDTTFLYTVGHRPAALYEGPLNKYSDQLDVFSNNSKESAIKSILQARVEDAYFEPNSYPEMEDTEFIKHLIETIVNFYCTGLPGFALVKISDVKQRNICFGIGAATERKDFKYNFDALVLKEEERYIESRKYLDKVIRQPNNPRKNLYYPEHFLSSDSSFPTYSVFENFCAKSKDLEGIPVYCVPCFDEYDIIKFIKEIENPKSSNRSTT